MYHLRSHLLALLFAAASIVSMSAMNPASAATAEDLDKDSRQALQTPSVSNDLGSIVR